MKIPRLLLFAFSILLLAGCQPVIELQNEALISPDGPAKSTGKAVNTTKVPVKTGPVATSTQAVSTPAATKTDGPPDWNARYNFLVGEVNRKFKAPPSSKKIPVAMKNGATRQGYLTNVAGERATFNVLIPGRDEPATVTIDRENLGDVTRRMVWVDDAASHFSGVRLKQEKKSYDAKQRQIASANTPEQSTTEIVSSPSRSEPKQPDRQGPGMMKTTVNPLTQNPDGSVDSVVNWLRNNIANPNSIRVHNWGRLERDPRANVNGFNLDIVFSSSGGSLGTIKEKKRFFFSPGGKITNVANVRQ